MTAKEVQTKATHAPEPIRTKPAKATRTGPAKSAKVEAIGVCRGKHSKCGGSEPSLSVRWHLGAKCTATFRAAQKGATTTAPKVASPAKAVKVASKAPAPARVAHPRVIQVAQPLAALVTPTKE